MNNENSNMQDKNIAYRNWFGAYSKPRATLTLLTGKKQKDDTKEEINSNDYSFNKLFDAFLFAFALAATIIVRSKSRSDENSSLWLMQEP